MSHDSPGAPQAFHLLAKPTGAVCNLDCKYCFFLSKERLYPNSTFRMSDEVLERYVQQLLESHGDTEVDIAWQGGEPTLMGLEFFERSVEYVEKYRRPGQRVRYSLQTNGTRLDDAWGAFLEKHGFLVGLSVDGPRELHDAYRVNKGGAGTFEQVMQGLAVLQRHGVAFNILCTVHAANAEHPLEVYRFFRDELGARHLQFIPIVEREAGNRVTERSVGAEQYGRFLIAIFEEWVRRDVGEVFVQMFDAALGAHVGQYSLCIFSPTCGDALALEHNGDLYSCDHYVEPDHLLGNIRDTSMARMVASEKQRKFGRDKQDTLPRYCRECPVRFACNGGCPRERFISTPGGEPGLNYLCAGYKLFFTHADRPMRIMAGLLQRDRAPSEIRQLYAREDAEHRQRAFARAGRNDGCPCGSGRKFKRCHGAHGAASAR
ncbi:anaerobic sulfatase maturase [Myxococcus sp. RHSTA-1-4]|uniref:anaerobic sulfatase maturase n=1 Tax=Myxococcus sp. RHSTA-1-4 TaxID=2874601 RepID=UPI001CC0C6DB|nr:anaerobic sulfatase maturase [Myxococcus sp. RHSTA-1-4]MBZ4419798.1 anaerobic sulfatase maturase [Myxococcus sp. RHSTA-1-4]